MTSTMPGLQPPAPYPPVSYPSVSYPWVDPAASSVPEPYGYQYGYQPDRFSAFLTRLARRSPRWLGPLAVAGCCAASAGYVLWSDPTEASVGQLPNCLVRLTTGFDCPGCGGTRAAWFLMHGDLAGAAQHHLLFVFAVPFLVYAYVAWAAGVLFGRRLPQLQFSFRALVIGLVAWGAFTVLRNLPFEPFTMFYV